MNTFQNRDSKSEATVKFYLSWIISNLYLSIFSNLWIKWVILFNRYLIIIPTFTNEMLRVGFLQKKKLF